MTNLLVELEDDLLAALTKGWDVVADAVEELLPEAQAALSVLFNEAVTDLTEGLPVDEIVTKVLNLAEAKGLSWVVDLETNLLRGLAGLLVAKAPSA